MTGTLSLFGRCPMPRCGNITGPSEVCDRCLAVLAEARGRHRALAREAAQKAAGRRRVIRRPGPDGQPEPLLWGWPASQVPPWIAGGARGPGSTEEISNGYTADLR